MKKYWDKKDPQKGQYKQHYGKQKKHRGESL